MKDKLLQIRVDEDFLSKLEYLQEINEFKSTAETVRKIVEKECRKELPSVRPKGKWIIDGHHRQCPICNISFCNLDREGDPIPIHFCPNCGKSMQQVD